MQKLLLQIVSALTLTHLGLTLPACADERAVPQIREEIWALPLPTPILAYMVRPVGKGPFPLVIMNHGVSLDPRERSFFPLIEFRDAAFWLARRSYIVVAPIRPGYGAAALDVPERGIYSLFLSNIGNCANPSFRDAGLAIASLNNWIIEFMAGQKLIVPDDVVVVGQSGGGWGAIALSSQNPPAVRAMIVFAGGRGGHLDGKPNNNCAPDKLVEATAEFGRTSRVPMLWIYTQNDTFFGPTLSKRMYEAFTAAGGNAEFHLLPVFGSDGHFMVDSKDASQIWAPLVSEFLDKHISLPPVTITQAQQVPPDASNPRKAPDVEIGPRGQRMPRDIKYSAWSKLCFRVPDAKMLCRTTISGTWDTGQIAIRVDLIEREGDSAARVQIYLPVGLYLQPGVKMTVDGGVPFWVPYVWCFTNACVAASLAEPELIREMQSGRLLTLEVVDSNILTVASSMSLDQFTTVHNGPPAQIFEQSLDNEQAAMILRNDVRA